MSARRPRLGLFEGYGIELEYMIVDRETFEVRPITDEVMKAVTGSYQSDWEDGAIGWSNELVLHVIELKTNGPADRLEGCAARFQRSLAKVNRILEGMGARLLGTAMHPWMDPWREMRLWPHEYNRIYESYNRIFDCRGHGWANLQSMHINLPFADDRQFGKLHAAIRLVLPLLPALAASSPYAEGKDTGYLDSRMDTYRTNSKKLPSMTGRVIPERLFTRREYEREILHRIWDDLSPWDPDQVLRGEFANARGAIARWDRWAIEIRVIDIQECPRADLAIAALVRSVLQALCEGRLANQEEQRAMPEDQLHPLLLACIQEGDGARIYDERYLELLGSEALPGVTARDLWCELAERHLAGKRGIAREWSEPLRVYADHGCLARRIRTAVGRSPSRKRLRSVYGRLADCLARGEIFQG